MQLTQKIKIMFGKRDPVAPDPTPRPLPGMAPTAALDVPAPLTVEHRVSQHRQDACRDDRKRRRRSRLRVGAVAHGGGGGHPDVGLDIPSGSADLRDLVAQHVANVVGMQEVAQIVLGGAGRSMYDIPSKTEIAIDLSEPVEERVPRRGRECVHGRTHLDVLVADAQLALLAGLLVDVGRPITLRVITRHFAEGERPDEPTAAAALHEIAGEVSQTTIAALALPAGLQKACGVGDATGPRCWRSAFDVQTHAEALQLPTKVVRTLFATRAQYRDHTTKIFS